MVAVTNMPDTQDLEVVRALAPADLGRVRDGGVLLYEDAELSRAVFEVAKSFVGTRAKEFFGVAIPDDLAQLHTALTRAQMAEIVRRAHSFRKDTMGIPRALAASLSRAGSAERVLISYNEHLRLIPPDDAAKTSGVPAHRDSWYSLPKEAVNVWIPCTDAPGVGLYPQWFGKKLSVGYRDEATHHHRVKSVDMTKEPMLAPRVPVGSCLLFCGNQLHRSRPNDSRVTRVSLDYRLLDVVGLAPSLRLHEFVFADLLLERPTEFEWMHYATQARLKRTNRKIWFTRGLTGSRRPKIAVTRFGRLLKNSLPGVFYS